MSKTCLVLWTSTPSTAAQEQGQRRLTDLLDGKKIVYQKHDGCVEENKAMRNELFAVSGKRGVYPQVFHVTGDSTEFIGDWDMIESLVESDSIEKAILDQNPEIKTFTKVFADCARS